MVALLKISMRERKKIEQQRFYSLRPVASIASIASFCVNCVILCHSSCILRKRSVIGVPNKKLFTATNYEDLATNHVC